MMANVMKDNYKKLKLQFLYEVVIGPLYKPLFSDIVHTQNRAIFFRWGKYSNQQLLMYENSLSQFLLIW